MYIPRTCVGTTRFLFLHSVTLQTKTALSFESLVLWKCKVEIALPWGIVGILASKVNPRAVTPRGTWHFLSVVQLHYSEENHLSIIISSAISQDVTESEPGITPPARGIALQLCSQDVACGVTV